MSVKIPPGAGVRIWLAGQRCPGAPLLPTNVPWAQRVTLPQTATSYTFRTALFPLNSYTFIIAAVDAAGNGSQAASVNTTLAADTTPPTSAPLLAVTDVGASHVSVAWTAAHDDAP